MTEMTLCEWEDECMYDDRVTLWKMEHCMMTGSGTM